jgi:hypothetical protein
MSASSAMCELDFRFRVDLGCSRSEWQQGAQTVNLIFLLRALAAQIFLHLLGFWRRSAA